MDVRRTSALVLAGVLAATALVGPSGCRPTARVQAGAVVESADPSAANGAPDPYVVDGVNGFGFALLGTMTRANGDATSTVVSPVSVALALAMTANGADGETLRQMRRALGTEALGERSANQAYANLIKTAQRSSDATLSIANSLWADAGIGFEEAFLASDREYFGARVTSLDLQASGTVDSINGWVEKQTNGLISNVVENISGQDVLHLVNTLYFKGRWVDGFREEATESQPFTTSAGEKVEVPLMTRHVSAPYVEGPSGQVVRLDYEEDTSMYVLLPREGVAPEEELKSMSGNNAWRVLTTSLKEREGRVWLPRFESQGIDDLRGPLEDLGMKIPFDASADFSRMTPEDVWIGSVTHATRVKVDETGTEAAAATDVVMAYKGATVSPPVETPFEMRVDRPFAFVIADERTGAVLFAGIVRDPR